MVTPVNFAASVSPGKTHISCGDVPIDIGILLCGDSNICGAGAGADPALDATAKPIYQIITNGNITQVDTSAPPFFTHSLNDGLDEVGPSLKFCDRYAQERTGKRARVVGIPCGDWASGFSTNQWYDGQSLYELMQSLTDTLLAQSNYNILGAVLVLLGTNDTGDFSPDTLWRDAADTFANSIHTNAFTGNGAMNSFAQVPICWAGVPEQWMGSVASRVAVRDYVQDMPNRLNYVGFVDTAGLAGQSGDIIHYTGDANREMGYSRAWTALEQAEANQ